jgi:hypothetical protein
MTSQAPLHREPPDLRPSLCVKSVVPGSVRSLRAPPSLALLGRTPLRARRALLPPSRSSAAPLSALAGACRRRLPVPLHAHRRRAEAPSVLVRCGT